VNRLQRLHDAGVSIWLDNLSRDLLESGAFAELVRDYAVTGATSNPTIFARAILASDRYDNQLRAAVAAGISNSQALFFELGLEDIRRAAQILRPIHEATGGSDGFASFECTPDVADDPQATVEQALELRERLHLPNVLIKVPATAAGVVAIEELTVRGVNVNVTLLFSIDRYEQVIKAYLAGLERRVEEGKPIGQLRSVASFFVSRVDTKADAQLEPGSPVRGRVAIANAQVAYARYRARFAGERWAGLERLGGQAAAPSVGEHRHQGPGLVRCRLRRAADRPGGDQHHARADATGLRRARQRRRCTECGLGSCGAGPGRGGRRRCRSPRHHRPARA